MKDNDIFAIQQRKYLTFKGAKIAQLKNKKNDIFINKIFNVKYVIILIIILIQFIFIYKINQDHFIYSQNVINNNSNFDKKDIKRKYDINFIYEDYDTEIITHKIKSDSKWLLSEWEAKFINGIIRKNQLKNCLEIGVAHGGSSILILNALKDIKDSILVSLDLNKELFNDPSKSTGYRVFQYFPNLTKKWKLYTGEQPHKFLGELNMKFDFLFLDSTHVTPGEIINFIEALPFLNENAIVVIHDITWHFGKLANTKFFPSCISLIPALYGDKVFLHGNYANKLNIGAVFLYPNQEEHYLDYFLLLLNFWEYIPKYNQINDLREFIKKYYKDEKYINLFDKAIKANKMANKKFIKYNNYFDRKKYLISLGIRWNISA